MLQHFLRRIDARCSDERKKKKQHHVLIGIRPLKKIHTAILDVNIVVTVLRLLFIYRKAATELECRQTSVKRVKNVARKKKNEISSRWNFFFHIIFGFTYTHRTDMAQETHRNTQIHNKMYRINVEYILLIQRNSYLTNNEFTITLCAG